MYDDEDEEDIEPQSEWLNEEHQTETPIYAAAEDIKSDKRARIVESWMNGDGVPFESIYLQPKDCTDSTLNVLLSHPEFTSHMDEEDAATVCDDERDVKIQAVQETLGDIQAEGGQVWLVSKNFVVENAAESAVVVRVDSLASATHRGGDAKKILETADFVQLRAPTR